MKTGSEGHGDMRLVTESIRSKSLALWCAIA